MSGTTYRPRSSVTAIFAKRVPSSVVSAMTQTPASGPNRLVTTPPMSSSSIAGAAGCWARSPGGNTMAAIAMAKNVVLLLMAVSCDPALRWRLGRADIAHRIEIRFAQLRRQRPHVEGVAARLALQPARPPLDLEIGVRPRSEPHLVLVAGGDTTEGLHREAIGAGWHITIGGCPGLAPRDGLAVGVYYRRSKCFLRVVVAQQPHPRHPRSERRDLRLRSRHVPWRRAGGRCQQAEAEQGQPDAMVFHDDRVPPALFNGASR